MRFVKKSLKTCTYLMLEVMLCASWPVMAQTLLPFDANTLAAIKQANAGKPFVLSFWALHCEPCRDEMGEWRAIKDKHPALPVVLVSTDSPRDAAVIAAAIDRAPAIGVCLDGLGQSASHQNGQDRERSTHGASPSGSVSTLRQCTYR